MSETVFGNINVDHVMGILYMQGVINEHSGLKEKLFNVVDIFTYAKTKYYWMDHYFDDVKTDDKQSLNSIFLALETI